MVELPESEQDLAAAARTGLIDTICIIFGIEQPNLHTGQDLTLKPRYQSNSANICKIGDLPAKVSIVEFCHPNTSRPYKKYFAKEPKNLREIQSLMEHRSCKKELGN